MSVSFHCIDKVRSRTSDPQISSRVDARSIITCAKLFADLIDADSRREKKNYRWRRWWMRRMQTATTTRYGLCLRRSLIRVQQLSWYETPTNHARRYAGHRHRVSPSTSAPSFYESPACVPQIVAGNAESCMDSRPICLTHSAVCLSVWLLAAWLNIQLRPRSRMLWRWFGFPCHSISVC